MERAELSRRIGGPPPAVRPRSAVVDAAAPGDFPAAFRAAVAGGGTVWVLPPRRGAAEQALAESCRRAAAVEPGADPERGWLCLPTGGSGGTPRLARHDQDTVAAAVDGACRHFGVARVNAVGVLPLHHVSGLMGWLRCALTGGAHVAWDWPDLEAGRWPEMPGDGWFLSLVPTQLQRLLGQPAAVERLRRFRAVFLGGGPAWPDLLDRAEAARLPLAPGYGMTETAAMVAALRPEEFLAGRRGCGAALPHARIAIGADGGIAVGGASLFRGYYPEWREPAGEWATGDAGRWDESGGLHVIGRRDAVIISGGEKIAPEVVEVALRATGEFADVVVVGVPDREWGQLVVACFPAGGRAPDPGRVGERIARELAPHQRPRRYVAIPWPRTPQGKINRADAARAALQALG